MKKRSKMLILMLISVIAISCLALTACGDKGGGGATVGGGGAYILSDKGTYLAYKKNPEGDRIANLEILFEKDASLINTYSMIAVDGDKLKKPVALNEAGADAFIKWMSLAGTRDIIAKFGDTVGNAYGEPLFYLDTKAQTYTGELNALKWTAGTKRIKVSTTTSVNDTGLLGYLEDKFEAETGWDIQVASAGTGAAIDAASGGNADMLLVHAKSSEVEFIKKGYARTVEGLTGEVVDAVNPQRVTFMYNYFVIVGPKADPAGVKAATSAIEAMKAIGKNNCNFISRGDASGTHTAEIKLFTAAEYTMIPLDVTDNKGNVKTKTAPAGSDGKMATWYVSAGQGMGACLGMASNYKTIG
ncbi:MAG: substrate-binding domain-containing protein [Clostridia bacterium]